MPKPFLVPLVLTEETAPSTPASSTVAFYAKTDGRFYGKDDTGLEFILGAGASIQADSAAAQTTTVTHNFGTRDVLVQVRRASGDYDYVLPYIEADTVNSVTVDFGEVVSAGAYRILVVAAANVAVFPYDQANTWTNTQTFSHATGVTTNTVTERTAAAGVTVDGVLLKDGGATFSGVVVANASNPSFKAEAGVPTVHLKTTQSGTQEWAWAGAYNDTGSISLVDVTAGIQLLRLQKNGNIASGETAFDVLRYHNGTTLTEGLVTVGAADSGGSGFRVLRVPN